MQRVLAMAAAEDQASQTASENAVEVVKSLFSQNISSFMILIDSLSASGSNDGIGRVSEASSILGELQNHFS